MALKVAKLIGIVIMFGLIVWGAYRGLHYLKVTAEMEKIGLPLTPSQRETFRRLERYGREYNEMQADSSEDEMSQPPGIRVGQDWPGRRVIYSDERLGRITALARQHDGYIAAGENGALPFDAMGRPGTFIPFEEEDKDIDRGVPEDEIVDIIQESEELWFLRQQEAESYEVTLLDGAGRSVYESSICCDGFGVAGDMNGDGVPELAHTDRGEVSYKGLDEDIHGWRSLDFWDLSSAMDIKLADLEGKGHKDIVCTTLAAQLVFMGLDLRIREKHNLPFLVNFFCLSTWPDSKGDACLVTAREADIVVLSLNGQKMRRFRLPDANWACLEAAPVRLKASVPSFFAVCGSYFHANYRAEKWPSKGFFALFDSNGKLVYHEMTAQACRAVLAIPQTTDDTEALLVGIGRDIWMFTAQ